MLKPVIANDLERAVDNALTEFKSSTTDQTSATLIKRSRDSFARHLVQLQEQIDRLNARLLTSSRARDEAIAQAHERHQLVTAEVERELHQIGTLRGVIEQAHAALAQAPDEA